MHNQETTNMNQHEIENVGTRSNIFSSLWVKYFSSFRNKLRGIIMASALFMGLLLLVLSYLIIRFHTRKETSDELLAISQFKQQQIEKHFYQLESQIILAGRDATLQAAMTDFSDAFNTIESDSYELPGMAGLGYMSTALEGYYSNDIIPVLNRVPGQDITLPDVLPYSDKTRIIQFLYIVNNTSPAGFKHRMLAAGDASTYSMVHQTYQPYFSDLLSGLGVTDILLIDAKKGNVVYTYQKNIDLGANIFSGVLKGSGLAIACQRALANPGSKRPSFSDVDLYLPAQFTPVMFIAIPVYGGSDLNGLLILELGKTGIDNLLFGATGKNQNNFLDKGGNMYLLGEDFAYRSDDYRLISSKADFARKLKHAGLRIKIIDQIDSLNTTIKLASTNHKIFEIALTGQDGVFSFRDITGEKAMAALLPVGIDKLNWSLIVQKSNRAAMKTANNFLLWGSIFIVVLFIILMIVTNKLSENMSDRVIKIKDSLHRLLSGGKVEELGNGSTDDLGEATRLVSNLASRIYDASNFAVELAEGNLDTEFESKGEADHIAGSLNKLRDSMLNSKEIDEKRKVEDEMRSWTTQGIARFNDLLRHETDNIERFSINIVKNLVEYLKANQGGLFLIEGEREEDKHLNLVAAYAYDRQKFLKKQVNIGEGLAGTVVLEKKSIFLKEIPDNYINITSGLGGAKPRSLMIVPLIFNEEVTGVFELASFSEFQPHEIEFVETIAENTALTLNSVRLNVYTRVLLEESNERAEELAAQEEEMRQNLEELKATQEEMQRIKEKEAAEEARRREQEKKAMEEIQKKNEELQEKTKALEWEQVMFNALMDSLPARVTFKDTESRYVRINKTKVIALGLKNSDEVFGKTDFDVFGAAHSQQAMDAEKEMIKSGTSVSDKEELIKFKDGRVSWGSTSRIPLRNEEGEIMGGLVITWDITERKNARFEIDLNKKLIDRITSNLPVLTYSLDKNGSILHMAGKGLEKLGHKETDLTGKSYFKLYPELKPILEDDLKEEGYSFSQIVSGTEFRHIIFANRMTTGGFTGIAFEVDVSRIL